VGEWYGDTPDTGWFAPGRGDPLPESSEEEASLVGARVAFFYDSGGGPLWDENGELTSDPEWLRRELGLSDAFIADLLAWVSDRVRREPGPVSAAEEQREERLFERFRKELRPGLEAVRRL
jgi:hypothetical protein